MQALNGSLTAALMNLGDVIKRSTSSSYRADSEPEVFVAAATYLLSSIINSLENQTVDPAISQVC